MFDWLSPNGKILFLTRSIRAFSLGFLSIALSIYLHEIGVNSFFIGIILSASILGAALFTLLTGHFAPVFGIKKMFLASLCISLFGVAIFLFTNNSMFLILASLLAFISPSGREIGPLLSLEQAYVPTTVDYKNITKAFSYLNIVDDLSGSIGNLFVAIPFFLQTSFHFEKIISYRALFLFYIILNIIILFFYTKLSEVHIKRPRIQLSEETKKRVTKLAFLFSIDSFGGGLVLDSIISLWFHRKHQ